MTKVVLVLEDSPDRVEWLTKIVSPTPVEHHESVVPFVEALRTRAANDTLAMVVFDHDLGHMPPDGMYGGFAMANYDRDGLCGADAAVSAPAFDAPALVWSWNSDGAKRIVAELDGKAEVVCRSPFTRSVEYAAGIANLMGGK